MSIRTWWRRMVEVSCDHHWHVDNNSFRKVKTDRPMCSGIGDESQKYIYKERYCSTITTFIDVKYIRKCCHCGEIEIVDTRYEPRLRRCNLEKAMTYLDIDDKPLETN